MGTELKAALIFGLVAVTGIALTWGIFSTLDMHMETDIASGAGVDKSGLKRSPGIVGASYYINTTPEELARDAKGKVILYDIWTYSCINCIRTLPHITAWNDKYSEQGLLIIGVHSPEFEFEKVPENVMMAVDKHGIDYPVVMDNNMETWNAFENRYWPRKYIADHEGYIRYDHIGEGRYQETEKIIQKLLMERAESLGIKKISSVPLVDISEFEHTVLRTPELYFGYKFAQNRDHLGSDEGFQPGNTVTYEEPDKIILHKFYPVGKWKNNQDNMQMESDTGKIMLLYNAKEVNVVAGGDAGLDISLDGNPIPHEYRGTDIASDSTLTVSEPRMYNVVSSKDSSSHVLEIKVNGEGFQMFTFTFG